MSDAKTNTEERAFGEETLASAVCLYYRRNWVSSVKGAKCHSSTPLKFKCTIQPGENNWKMVT